MESFKYANISRQWVGILDAAGVSPSAAYAAACSSVRFQHLDYSLCPWPLRGPEYLLLQRLVKLLALFVSQMWIFLLA